MNSCYLPKFGVILFKLIIIGDNNRTYPNSRVHAQEALTPESQHIYALLLPRASYGGDIYIDLIA